MVRMLNLYKQYKASSRQPKVRLGLLVLMVSFLSLIVTLVYWVPLYTEYSNQWSEFQSLTDDIKQSKYKVGLFTAYKKSNLQVKEIEEKLALGFNQSNQLKEISDLADKYAINIVSETFKNEINGEGVSTLIHRLALEADYQSVRKFLTKISVLSSWTIIESIKIAKSLENEKQVSVQLKLATFSRKNDA